MKIVFFGTPSFAAKVLEYLIQHSIQIAGVVAQPDRMQGRSLHLTAPEAKQTALRLVPQVPLFQPEKASDPAFLQELSALKADLFVVVAYGQILSRKLLAIPPLGCINVHASLLPLYRGAAPMQRALMDGAAKTGIAIQKMVYELDAGDVIDAAEISVDEQMTFGQLEEALCALANPLLLSILKRYDAEGIPSAVSQNSSLATYASKLCPEEMQIDWGKDALSVHNLIRALSPKPGAWCWIQVGSERKRLKILRTKFSPLQGSIGEFLSFTPKSCVIAAKTGALELLEVQPEGKKIMPAADWVRGCQTIPKVILNLSQ